MVPIFSRAAAAAVASLAIFFAGCAPTASRQTAPSPPASACSDPVYLQLSAQPDSLSDRERVLVHGLDVMCAAEHAAEAEAREQPRTTRRDGMHRSGWLWMPAMMVIGSVVWLLLGT